MLTHAMAAACPVVLQSFLKTPDVVDKLAFPNMPSEVIVNLIDELRNESLYWAVKILLSRNQDDDLRWQIQSLKN